MNEKFLGLTPERYLCPYCGQWHDWPKDTYPFYLGCYDIKWKDNVKLTCTQAGPFDLRGYYKFYIMNGSLYYEIQDLCRRYRTELEGRIAISDIVESCEGPFITFECPVQISSPIGPKHCAECKEKCVCATYQQAVETGSQDTKIRFGFKFDEDNYNEMATHPIGYNRPATYTIKKLKKLPILPIKNKQQLDGKPTRPSNIYNISLEFGMNTDENIASTLMGVAVRSNGNWRIYDKDKGEITDIGDIELAKFPLGIIPTTKLSEGDLIKEDHNYYYVIEVSSRIIKTMCVGTGEIKTAMPIKNILGINCYSKVVALIDTTDIAEYFDTEKLLIMSAMCGQFAKSEDQTLLQLSAAPEQQSDNK